MENIYVSIIMPVYNSGQYLPDAIESVRNQTYQNWELIIVDDHSTDNSTKIIEKYALTDSRIVPIYLHHNGGAAAARNVGIERRRGRFLAFLDSDDTWSERKLEIQLAFMEKNHYVFTYTSYDLMTQNGLKMGVKVTVPYRLSYREALTKTAISTITVCLDTDQLSSVKMPLLKGAEDTATWLSILKNIEFAYGIDMILASYRQVPTSLSHNLTARITRTWKLYRQIEGFSLLKSLRFYIRYVFYVLNKRKRG